MAEALYICKQCGKEQNSDFTKDDLKKESSWVHTADCGVPRELAENPSPLNEQEDLLDDTEE